MNAVTTVVLLMSLGCLVAFPTGAFRWTLPVVAIACAGSWALTVRRRAREPGPGAPGGLRLLEGVHTVLLVLLLLSLLPLPLSATSLTGRVRWEQNAVVVESLERAAEAGFLEARKPWFAFTRNGAGTVRVTLLCVAAFSAAFLALTLRRASRRLVLRGVVVMGSAVAVAGLVSRLFVPQGDALWWVFPIPHGLPGPVAGSVNPNHFAALLVILCPAALGFLVDDWLNRRWVLGMFSGLQLVLLTAGIVLSYSRGALTAYGVSVGATVVVLFLSRRRVAAVCVLALGILCAVGVVRAPVPAVQERVQSLRRWRETDSYQTRVKTWRDSLLVWRTYPVAGAGANAFRCVYPQHRRTSDGAFMSHAENEYVQLLTDFGAVGVVLLIVAFIALARLLMPTPTRCRAAPVLMAASVGAVVAAGAHAVVEFALHIPLYAVMLGTVAGAGFGALGDGESTESSGAGGAGSEWRPALGLGVALLVAVFWGRDMRLDAPAVLRRAPLERRVRALVLAPTSWHAWYRLARSVRRMEDPGAAEFTETCLSQAVAYDPNNYRLWLSLGRQRLKINDRAGARAAFARVRELRYWVAVPDVPEDD